MWKLTLLFLPVTLSCGGDHRPRRPVSAPRPPATNDAAAKGTGAGNEFGAWKLDWWRDKASRTLAGAETAGLTDPAGRQQMSREAFVDSLMTEPGFIDTTLRFNLYFLGLRRDQVREGKGGLSPSALAMPQALSAARAVAGASDGKDDFLSLIRYEQPSYVEPMGTAFLPDKNPDKAAPKDPTAKEPTQDEVRQSLRAQMDTELAADRQLAGAAPVDKPKFCDRLFGGNDQEFGLPTLLQFYGLPSTLAEQIDESDQWFGGLVAYCFFDAPQPDLGQRLAFIGDTIPKLLTMAKAWSSDTYKLGSVGDVKTFDPASIGLSASTSMPPSIYFQLQNSSTNFDRRRAAYMLQRYFCDDLTPISVALPEDHPKDRHAADPGCQSCHYKLDPMAGFFKTRGALGRDFGGVKEITFDDGAKADLTTYEANWKAAAGSGRSWDIGFVRSVQDPTKNSYGETLADLFGIIGKAPETRQCLVRRMFEFYVGEGQAIDPGYLEDLTTKFDAEAASDANAAYKHTVARLILGNTFGEPDAVSSECYDRAPGASAEPGPPCQVSFVLQRDCASCHAGSAPAAGLDLTKWITVGEETTFFHAKDGQQVSRSDTLKSVLDRLTSTDRTKRMPLGQDMPGPDREKLVLWLNDALNH